MLCLTINAGRLGRWDVKYRRQLLEEALRKSGGNKQKTKFSERRSFQGWLGLGAQTHSVKVFTEFSKREIAQSS